MSYVNNKIWSYHRLGFILSIVISIVESIYSEAGTEASSAIVIVDYLKGTYITRHLKTVAIIQMMAGKEHPTLVHQPIRP